MDPKSIFQRKEVQQLFHAYGIDTAHATLIRSNTNLIYDCGTAIIRLTPATVRTRLDIASELAWLAYLREEGAPVVELISDSEPITLNIDAFTFWGVIFTKIQGRKVEAKDWNAAHFARLGQLTGLLHRLGRAYQWTKPFNYRPWDKIPEFENFPKLAQTIPGGVELHQAVVAHIKNLPTNPSNYGLVHYDIHHGNYLLQADGSLVLFDFELCCQTWYVYDVAIVLYYAANHLENLAKVNFLNDFLENFWSGYTQEYQKPSKEERAFIPTFLLYRDLMVYSYVLDIWDRRKLTEQQRSYMEHMEQSIDKRRRIFVRK